MLSIKITQEFSNAIQMADALEMIATRVRHNIPQGKSPDYHVVSDGE